MNTNPQNLSRQNCPHVLNSPTITGCKTPTITSRQRHHTNVSAVDDYVSNNQFPSITFSNNQYPSITWQGQKIYPENCNQGNSMSKQQMTQVRATANLPQGNGDDDCSWFLHVMKPLKSLMRRHVTIIVLTVKYCSSYTLKKNIITMNLGDISKEHFSVIM